MNDITTIGIDVSKKYLDIHIFPVNKKLRIDNTVSSINNFCNKIKDYNLKQIAFEASGGYEHLTPFLYSSITLGVLFTVGAFLICIFPILR